MDTPILLRNANGSPTLFPLNRRRRSPLNRPRFWYWAVALLAVAFVYDGAMSSQPAMGEEKTASAETKTEKTGHANDNGHSSNGHSNPVAPVLAAIVMILFLAKTGGDLFERISMPAVLGELTVGIVLGNLTFLTGWDGLDGLFKLPDLAVGSEFMVEFVNDPKHLIYNTPVTLKILAEIGVILLLFEVGLESTVKEMMSVGKSSLVVAVLGVVVPMALGWGVGWMLINEAGWEVHAFLGATLCATSVGITARVLKDIGRSQQRESQIILGAAVIDDVLGLVILAVVTGVIQQGEVSVPGIFKIVGLAFGFLAGAVVIGAAAFARPLFRAASFLRGHGILVAGALVICFGFSWLANLIGLAPIVGAFAAGLILEKTHYRELGKREDHELEDALAPISALLVPIFFVQMGTQVDISSFTDSSVWLLAGSLTVVAIIGKQVCSFGVLEPGLNKAAVGLGMIPRGEVGLIFAGVGKDLVTSTGDPVIDKSTFSAVIVMVMVTTMVTPPLLKWAMNRGDRNNEKPSEESTPD